MDQMCKGKRGIKDALYLFQHIQSLVLLNIIATLRDLYHFLGKGLLVGI